MMTRFFPRVAVTTLALLTSLTAASARAQDYAGPFATAAAGGTARFAQTFTVANTSVRSLNLFNFALGDFNADASGAGLLFRTSVYTVVGSRLGTQLYQSDVRTGSANYTGFDRYLFTPNVLLTPGVTTFAMVMEAVGGPATAQDVIATSGTGQFYTAGQLFTVDATGGLAMDLGTDAMFTVAVTATPEPGSVALLAGGLAGIAMLVRRRRRI